MKLLLTSAGLTNQTLADSLAALVGKAPADTKVGFVPTAANVEPGNKDWFIAQLTNLHAYGYEWVEVVDPSAAGVDWRTRLADVDVVFVSGGSTFHLLDQMRLTGFGEWVTSQRERKVYVGASAGSIVATPTIRVASVPPADINPSGITDLTAMGWVDFELEPHCDAARCEVVQAYARQYATAAYALDDASAIEVVDGAARVVGEGRAQLYPL
jgi:dipeptidase E